MKDEEIEKAAAAYAIKIWGDPQENKQDTSSPTFSFTELQWQCHKDFIAGWKACEQNAWVKCSERLPKRHELVCCHFPHNSSLQFCEWNGMKWERGAYATAEKEDVAHWMPFPALPIEEPKE